MPPHSAPPSVSRTGRSVRFSIALLIALTLLAGLTTVSFAVPEPPASDSVAGPGVITENPQDAIDAGRGIYIVTLQADPLPLYRGGARTSAGTELAIPERYETGSIRLDGAATQAYLAYLADDRANVLRQFAQVTGGSVAIDDPEGGEREYGGVAIHGFAIAMTPDQALAVASISGVERIEPEALFRLQTDVGPEWIEAPTAWGETPDTGTGDCEVGFCGEGVVVGILDSGVTPGHASYADIGPLDGYDHNNPYGDGVYFGACKPDGAAAWCGVGNDKLIGMYDHSTTGPILPTSTGPQDDNGHGSHTSSTAAGNALDITLEAPTIDIPRTVSGVAPHANIISYKVCISQPADVGCLEADTLAAIEQATTDAQTKGPNDTPPPFVINFSITGPGDPFADAVAQAYLAAREAGVFVSVSAGNTGPGAATVNHNAPWIMTNGASTHTRVFSTALINMTSTTGTPPGDPPGSMEGKGVTRGYPEDPAEDPDPDDGRAPIVWAGDYELDGDGDCGVGEQPDPTDPNSGPPVDPFPNVGPDAVDFDGAIVVCIRGIYGRVAKGIEVMENGAGAMVLINDLASGDSLTADAHVLPATHLTYEQGQALLDWLLGPADEDGNRPGTGEEGAAENPQGAIRGTGTTPEDETANADIMASFSSRGPNPTVPDVIKPDVTSPGVDILAAWMDTDDNPQTSEFNVISGTSMSSPHNAGAAAVVRSAHPDWTPGQVQSALMTTSFDYLPGDGDESHSLLDEDAETPADPFDFGAGRVDVGRAVRAGLVMDESIENFEAADPAGDPPGEPGTLNIPSVAENECSVTCSWSRTFVGTTAIEGGVDWVVSADNLSPGITVDVSPSEFTLDTDEEVTLKITATVGSAANVGDWHFGRIVLTPQPPQTGRVTQFLPPVAHLPLAVLVTPAPLDPPVLDDPPDSASCAYDLTWSDIENEEGYRVQQSTDFTVALEDDAEGGMGTHWTTEGTIGGAPTVGWIESAGGADEPGSRANSGLFSYWSGNAVGDYIVALELTDPIEVPAGADLVVSFASFESMEPFFDYGFVQASMDGGTTWITEFSTTGNPDVWQTRSAAFKDLEGDVLVRFLYVADLLVGPEEGYEGWYVDDINLSVGSWTDVGDTAADVTTLTVTQEEAGTFFHRVAGFVSPLDPVLGPWSNVQDIVVDEGCTSGGGSPPPSDGGPAESPAASPRPSARFIPNTAVEWTSTPAGIATVTLLVAVVSAGILAGPRVAAWRRSRR